MRNLAVALIVTGLALSAAEAKVTVDSDPSAPFASYKSYYWVKKPEGISPLMQQRIVDGIDARLRAKGWTLGETGDVALATNISAAQNQTLDTFYTGGAMGGWGWRGGWGGGWGSGSATTTVRTYTVGTLVIDMFDAGTKQAVWRGTISATLRSSPNKNTSMLNKDLDKLFAKFPGNP